MSQDQLAMRANIIKDVIIVEIFSIRSFEFYRMDLFIVLLVMAQIQQHLESTFRLLFIFKFHVPCFSVELWAIYMPLVLKVIVFNLNLIGKIFTWNISIQVFTSIFKWRSKSKWINRNGIWMMYFGQTIINLKTEVLNDI